MVAGKNGRVGDGDKLDQFGLQFALGITPFDEYYAMTT